MEDRLFIALPSQDTWQADTSICFANMVLWLQKTGVDFMFYNVRSSILPDSRNILVEMAKEAEASHILFLDSDMVYPRNTANRLLEHRKDIVAANCVTRSRPANTTARIVQEDGIIIHYPVKGSGLTEIDFVGTGIMLIDMKVFGVIEKPYFMNIWQEDKERIMGEDWYFVHKASLAGSKAYVDDGLSWEIRHLGVYPYSLDDVDYPPDKKEMLREYITNAAGSLGKLHTGS